MAGAQGLWGGLPNYLGSSVQNKEPSWSPRTKTVIV